MKKIEYSGMRATIGEYIHLASRINPVSVCIEADARWLMEFCSRNNVTYTPVLLKIIAQVQKKYPMMNAILARDIIRKKIFLPDDVDISFAMEKKHRGGIVVLIPIIRQVNKKSINAISAEIKHLSELPFDEMPQIKLIKHINSYPDFLKYLTMRMICQSAKLYNFFFGTVGFSNLGKFGITHFFPLWINTTVFGIGTIEEKPVVRNGTITTAQMLYLTIAFNHRILDGSAASEILAEVKRTIEDEQFYQSVDDGM
jgi:pyruvate/2-oxoglutarate dehydrogenase complex dihydrolipoamide acyltransferase (E2) component